MQASAGTRERAPQQQPTPGAVHRRAEVARPRSTCACGGGCARCVTAPATPALTLGAADAAQERRAEGMAATLLGWPEPPALPVHGDAAGSPRWQMPAAVHDALGRPGQPLEQALRRFFEPRLARDLGQVRVHTDGRAARSASGLHADAWTLGRHVFFARGRYVPHDAAGLALIAHELSHTLDDDRGTVRRRPADATVAPAADEGEPVELPEDITEQTLQLASATAEAIDDDVTRDWPAATHSGSQAMLLAGKVERTLADVFERGYRWDTPQLRKQDAPVLQYFVARHPGLRDRLAVLRRLAFERNTPLVGKYLDIAPGAADAFTYQIMMQGASGGEGLEGMRQLVLIRYLEDGKPVWTRPFMFRGFGVGAGEPLPGNISGDLTWNDFYSGEYWAPDEFAGTMMIVGASAGGFEWGGVVGYEIEGVTLYGSGEHAPIDADTGGKIWGTPEVGFGGFACNLVALVNSPAPDPGHGVLPAPPPYVQRPEISDPMTVRFATGESALDEGDLLELAAFVGRWRDVFDGGRYGLDLLGQASRTGSASLNERLSAERVAAVRAALKDFIGLAWDDDKVSTGAVGEEFARFKHPDPDDDSADDRVVDVTLVGKLERRAP